MRPKMRLSNLLKKTKKVKNQNGYAIRLSAKILPGPVEHDESDLKFFTDPLKIKIVSNIVTRAVAEIKL